MSGPNQGWNPDGTPKADADQQPSDPGQQPSYPGQPQGYQSPLQGYPGYAPPPTSDQMPMPPPYPGPGPDQQPYGGPAQPYYPPQPSYPPPAPPPSRRGQWLRVGIILLIAVVVGVGFVLFRDRLSGSAGDLAVGDCIDEPAATTEISEVQHQPCNEPHDGEVFAVVSHTAGSAATYPPDSEFRDLASDECTPALQAYTGMNIVEFVTAGFDFSVFFPNAEGWSGGSREVTCYLVRADGSKMTESVRVASSSPSP